MDLLECLLITSPEIVGLGSRKNKMADSEKKPRAPAREGDDSKRVCHLIG